MVYVPSQEVNSEVHIHCGGSCLYFHDTLGSCYRSSQTFTSDRVRPGWEPIELVESSLIRFCFPFPIVIPGLPEG